MRKLEISLLMMFACLPISVSASAADGNCIVQNYATGSMGGSYQLVGVERCGTDVKMVLNSAPEESAKIGLPVGSILFSGSLNEEIPGFEGVLTLLGKCGATRIDAQGVFTGLWTPTDLASEIAFDFEVTTHDQACKPNGIAPYMGRLSLHRLDSGFARPESGGTILPDEGCDAYEVFDADVAVSSVSFCNTSGKLRAKFTTVSSDLAAGGYPRGGLFFYGHLYGLDGSIEGTGHVYSKRCRTVGYRLTGGTNEPELEPVLFLEGRRPQLDEKCLVTSYEAVRLRLVKQ